MKYEVQKYEDIFRGYRNGTMAWQGLTLHERGLTLSCRFKYVWPFSAANQ